jgi:hypothetical protein
MERIAAAQRKRWAAVRGQRDATGDAQETDIVGGRVESHKESHEEAVGGLPASQERRGVS